MTLTRRYFPDDKEGLLGQELQSNPWYGLGSEFHLATAETQHKRHVASNQRAGNVAASVFSRSP